MLGWLKRFFTFKADPQSWQDSTRGLAPGCTYPDCTCGGQPSVTDKCPYWNDGDRAANVAALGVMGLGGKF